MPLTLLNPKQIDLRKLISVERVLAARGIKVKSTESLSVTLLGADDQGSEFESFFYEKFSNSDVRFELLKICEGTLPKNDATHCRSFIDNLIIDRQRFSKTLEWFIGEMLVREFQSFSSGFGVKISGLNDQHESSDIGDFDMISVLGDITLLYVECKSGATNAVEICKAVRRGRLIGSSSTVVALDRKTGNINMLNALLGQEPHPELLRPSTVYELSSIGLPNSTVIIWGNTFFLPLVSVELKNGLSTILRLIGQQRAGKFWFSFYGSSPFTLETQETFRTMGFHLSLA